MSLVKVATRIPIPEVSPYAPNDFRAKFSRVRNLGLPGIVIRGLATSPGEAVEELQEALDSTIRMGQALYDEDRPFTTGGLCELQKDLCLDAHEPKDPGQSQLSVCTIANGHIQAVMFGLQPAFMKKVKAGKHPATEDLGTDNWRTFGKVDDTRLVPEAYITQLVPGSVLLAATSRYAYDLTAEAWPSEALTNMYHP